MSYFGHLRSVKKGDRDWIVPVSLHGYTPPKQRGFVPDGKYAARIVDASGGPSEKGNGLNLRMMLRIEAPAEYANVEIEDWMYMRFDDAGDATVQERAGWDYHELQHLLRSIASATPGKLEGLMALGPDGKPQKVGIGPSVLLNKQCFIETERGDANAVMKDGKVRDLSNQSKVAYYIGREDYEKRPGPSPVGSQSAAQQGPAPELSGRGGQAAAGNGTGATPIQGTKATAKVDDLVDF